MHNYLDDLSTEIATITAVYAEYAARYNLNLNEFRVLYYIFQHPDCQPSQISNKWSIPRQTLTSICNKFIKKNYLQYQIDREDRRKKNLSFTLKGQQFFTPIMKKLNVAELAVSKIVQSQEIRQFNTIFQKISSELDQHLK